MCIRDGLYLSHEWWAVAACSQDEDALQETAELYNTVPLVVPRVAHDLMLDVNWEIGAAALAELVAALPK